jgi:hypothetical protein
MIRTMAEIPLPAPSKIGGSERGLGANNKYMTSAITTIPIIIEVIPSVLWLKSTYALNKVQAIIILFLKSRSHFTSRHQFAR